MRIGEWKISGYDRESVKALYRSGINPLVAALLVSRGISDIDGVNALIACDESSVCDPYLFEDMDKAVERIVRAMNTGEHIAVYGDYDVDGITSTCLLTSYFRSRGMNCELYIPERLDDGYGIKQKGIDALAEKGVTLIISVDCGITAIDEVEYASSRGMEFIVTDHHECADVLPNAVAVIDPKRKDSSYPEKALAGVGVAFKLMCAVDDRPCGELLSEYGDFVAIGTIADVVPVIGENRVFIRRGLEKIKTSGRVGIIKLCEAAGIDPKMLTAGNVGFTLAPRINAAGRLGKTATAKDLLMTESEDEAESIAQKLCDMNRSRQVLEGEIFAQALGMLESMPPDGKPIVLASEEWHQGVTGIVASRLTERYSLPAIIICMSGDVGKGSCRSYGGFNLYEALEKNSDLLVSYGGHEMAAGLTIEKSNVDKFRESIGHFYTEIAKMPPIPELKIDFEVIKPEILSLENVRSLSVLEPYGTCNQPPLLCMTDVEVRNIVPISSGKHTKFWAGKGGDSFECVFFSKTVAELGISEGRRADIAFTPQINEFRGRHSVQLNLTDLRLR